MLALGAALVLDGCAFGCSVAALFVPWCQACPVAGLGSSCSSIGIVQVGSIARSTLFLLPLLAPGLLLAPVGLVLRPVLPKAGTISAGSNAILGVGGLVALCAASRPAAETVLTAGQRLVMPQAGWYLALVGLVCLMLSAAISLTAVFSNETLPVAASVKAPSSGPSGWWNAHVSPLWSKPGSGKYRFEFDSMVDEIEAAEQGQPSVNMPQPWQPQQKQQQQQAQWRRPIEPQKPSAGTVDIVVRTPAVSIGWLPPPPRLPSDGDAELPLAPELSSDYAAPSLSTRHPSSSADERPHDQTEPAERMPLPSHEAGSRRKSLGAFSDTSSWSMESEVTQPSARLPQHMRPQPSSAGSNLEMGCSSPVFIPDVCDASAAASAAGPVRQSDQTPPSGPSLAATTRRRLQLDDIELPLQLDDIKLPLRMKYGGRTSFESSAAC